MPCGTQHRQAQSDRFATTSTGASVVCCPRDAATGRVVAGECREDVLFLDDGTDKRRMHSALSVALVIDGKWAGRGARQSRLVFTGSWYDNGLGACWV
jgi:hypothetical protein